MFDIKTFMESPTVDESIVVSHGTEEFAIRRLNGTQRLAYHDFESVVDRTVFVLANCLLSGSAKVPIGEENAARFLEKYDRLSNLLVGDVLELTSKALEEETKIWEAAKKKSSKTTDTKSSGVNTVVATE